MVQFLQKIQHILISILVSIIKQTVILEHNYLNKTLESFNVYHFKMFNLKNLPERIKYLEMP